MKHPIALALLLSALLFAALAAALQDGAEVTDSRWTQVELDAVTELIRGEIEELRGERFKGPVEVRVTGKEGLVRHAKERMDKMTQPGELEAEQDLARLFALVPRDVDLLESSLALLEEQVGGFYDPSTKTMYLMDTYTGTVAEVILAHELTHALDDQLFDIDAGFSERLSNADAVAAFSAAVEGSGTSLMTRWLMKHAGRLSPEDLAAAGGMGAQSLGDAPPYLWKPLLFAYLGGQRFLERGLRLRRRRGEDYASVVRETFERPPLSTEQVLHPDKYWSRESWDPPRPVRHVDQALPEGWEVLDRRVLGELVVALLVEPVGERAAIDLANPMQIMLMRFTSAAAEGWGGDGVLLLGRGAARLAHAVTLWDGAEDAREFRAALEARLPAWRSALAEPDSGEGDSGVEFLEARAPDEVRFYAWVGAPAEDAAGIAGALEHEELPSAEWIELHGGTRGEDE